MTRFKPFRAKVSPTILEKAPRFFNGTFSDIFNELLQNARRAGATRVDIQTIDTPNGQSVRVRDDGEGIRDPKTVLSLGGSDWQEGIQQAEDPAGIGVFALASRGATFCSRHRSSRSAWQMTLHEAHFEGKADIRPQAADLERGTEITFLVKPGENPQRAVENAALHYPLPVTFNGAPVEQRPFLDGAIHTETWRGLTIGVFKGTRWSQDATINFHGVTIAQGIALIDGSIDRRQDLYVKIDVQRCADLKLVLPARKEVVADAFFTELKREAECALYRTIKSYSEHSLPFQHWQRAKVLGIDLVEATPRLTAFRPSTGSESHRQLGEVIELPASKPVLVWDGDEAAFEQCLARAMNRSEVDSILLDAEKAYAGYSWYDALPKLEDVRWFVRDHGVATELHDYTPSASGSGHRPQAIYAVLSIANRGQSTTSTRIEADLIFAGDPMCIDEVEPVVAADSSLSPGMLAAIIVDSYFYCSDDCEAGSYDDQKQHAEDEARDVAVTLLVSAKAAHEAALRDEIYRYISWRLPRNRRILIVCEGFQVRFYYAPLSMREHLRRLRRDIAQKLKLLRETFKSGRAAVFRNRVRDERREG